VNVFGTSATERNHCDESIFRRKGKTETDLDPLTGGQDLAEGDRNDAERDI